MNKEHKTGRPRYNREKLLKIVLFTFMGYGYPSLRQIAKLCETDFRFMWILDEAKPPCFNTIKNFINDISRSLETLKKVVEVFVYAYNKFGIAKTKYKKARKNKKVCSIPFSVIDFS